MKVLVVEDEPAIRGFLRLALEQEGFEVSLAPNAATAKSLCESGSFDLVLSDVVMPGSTGHELVAWLAGHCPETRTLLMSGAETECAGCPYKTGCTVILKPFSLDRIVNEIRRQLAA
jgi:two-component system, cell cycle response regulator CpdR